MPEPRRLVLNDLGRHLNMSNPRPSTDEVLQAIDLKVAEEHREALKTELFTRLEGRPIS